MAKFGEACDLNFERIEGSYLLDQAIFNLCKLLFEGPEKAVP